MRPILKRLEVGSANERREIVQDDWKYLGEEGAADAAALIVPFAEFEELAQSPRSPGRASIPC